MFDFQALYQTKQCPRCQQIKMISDFGVRGPKMRPRSYCVPCRREYSAEHYQKNSDKYKQRARNRTDVPVRRCRERLAQFLRNHPCVDCQEADVRVLEFDHVRGKKDANVSLMAAKGFSWQRIEAEIAKCEVRCANCHRRRTHATLWEHSKIRRVVAQPGRAPRLGRGGRRFDSSPPDAMRP